MTLRVLAWWCGGVWAGVGLGLVLLAATAELFGQPRRPWREGLLHLARHAHFLIVVVLGWPLLALIAFLEIRRETLLERVCYGQTPKLPPVPLTEKEWDRGGEPAVLLRRLGDRVSLRKHRLFACACCRSIWVRFTDDRSRRAVTVAERQLDGRTANEEVRQANQEAASVAALLLTGGDLEAAAAARACQDCLVPDGASAAARAAVSYYPLRKAEAHKQLVLLREILGNPFHPLSPRPFPAEVRELARACYEGDHALYPLLADALAELGADEAAAHCRQPIHHKGCHVVDWVLGLD